MLNSPLLRIFKTKSFKAISLLTALTISSSLMVLTNFQTNTSVVSEKNKISGFHITVKQNNENILKETKVWNTINDNYEDFILNHKEQLITAQFDKWSDIINQKQAKEPSDDMISKKVNIDFTKQVQDKDNHILPEDGKIYFTNKIIGRSVAKKDFNNVNSFGYVYVNYHDNLPTQVHNGLFATVNPSNDFNDYFSIPYTIKPSDAFLKTNPNIEDRIKEIPLDNNNSDSTNQPILVILVKTGKEQLKINGHTDIFDNGAVSYALLNHNPSDGLNATKFNISVNDSNFTKSISLTNNCSTIQFNTNNANKDNNLKVSTQVNKQYLVKIDDSTNNNTLLVMNQGVESVKVNFNEKEQWRKWSVNPKTLEKNSGDPGIKIENDAIISVNAESDFQVYCLGLNTTDKGREKASEQYVVVYKKDTSAPSFKNCSDFFEQNNNKSNETVAGFKQYLASSSDINIDDLKKNAGELLSWFIEYQGNITNHNYVNYLQSDNPEAPWNINQKLKVVTLVNNWNIIVIFGLIFSLLIVVPIVIVVMRRKKHLK